MTEDEARKKVLEFLEKDNLEGFIFSAAVREEDGKQGIAVLCGCSPDSRTIVKMIDHINKDVADHLSKMAVLNFM